MSTATQPAAAQVSTRHLFRMTLTTPPPYVIGTMPFGARRVIPVSGGTFEGERLRGVVLPGNSDWQTRAADGTTLLDVRVVLQTSDGALIQYQYRGVRAAPADVLARLDRGDDVDPSTYYMRTIGTLETASAAYAWLNRIVAVAVGARFPTGPVYDVFEVL